MDQELVLNCSHYTPTDPDNESVPTGEVSTTVMLLFFPISPPFFSRFFPLFFSHFFSPVFCLPVRNFSTTVLAKISTLAILPRDFKRRFARIAVDFSRCRLVLN